MQSFIASNLSNNTRRISNKPSIIRRRSSAKSTNKEPIDESEHNAKVSNVKQSQNDSFDLGIDTDVDECQQALSPKVLLSRLKCSPEVKTPTKETNVPKRKLSQELGVSSDDDSEDEESDDQEESKSESEAQNEDQVENEKEIEDQGDLDDNAGKSLIENAEPVQTSPINPKDGMQPEAGVVSIQDDRTESHDSVKSSITRKISSKRRIDVTKDTIIEEDAFREPHVAPIRPPTKESTTAETRPKFRLKGSNLMKRQRASMLRAISTPTKDDTIMRENVTFNISGVANCTDDISLANLSAIPILSPPSPERESRRVSKKKSLEQEEQVGMESFRFAHGKKDEFEEMVRRGSKDHAKNIETEKQGKESKSKNAIEPELEIPEKRSSKVEKEATRMGLPSDEQIKEMEYIQKDEEIIHKPQTKSPFKAIRGEGNSFHGWFS